MRITASHIITWVNQNAKLVQADLPRWIRRLCYAEPSTQEIAFPAGDSTNAPGWDGILKSSVGTPWIPKGKSFWEIGCDLRPAPKASREYKKRTAATSRSERRKSTFVFVTPRRWARKSKWIQEKVATKEWARVRVIDADDLEQWLEQRPVVALQLAEEMGHMGVGVVSLARFWTIWSEQCSPPISSQAFKIDRTTAERKLTSEIERCLLSNRARHVLSVFGDSALEAAAFAACVAREIPRVDQFSLVVTAEAGWHYVESNPQVRLAIAADSTVAANPSSRTDLLVIVPSILGDRARNDADDIFLDRPEIYKFAQALIDLGLEQNAAQRIAPIVGRSWTVFRRQHAKNPAIRSPAWLTTPSAYLLPALCLIPEWNADSQEDRKLIERLCSRSYGEIETDLGLLSQVDDAPVLRIGRIWKTKSPLELLNLAAPRISKDLLDRYFQVVKEVFLPNDPSLELPNEQRWLASVYNKLRPTSATLFKSLGDSLIRLSVHGSQSISLRSLQIEARIAWTVRELLQNADEERWLSLADHLPALAEAAPDTFLTMVEESLQKDVPSVHRLFTETGGSGFSNKCWHAGLLWALEVLAWSPEFLGRVASILTNCARITIQGNWGNSPTASLVTILHPWIPHTAAQLDERIGVLRYVAKTHATISFEIALEIFGERSTTIFPTQRPVWRDSDRGAGNQVSASEHATFLEAVRGLLINASVGDAKKIATLTKTSVFWSRDSESDLISLLTPFNVSGSIDDEKETLRAGLRHLLHWHQNYKRPEARWIEKLEPFSQLYDALEPTDLVIRHSWLFGSRDPSFPFRNAKQSVEERDAAILTAQTDAIHEIYEAGAFDAVDRLIESCESPKDVGWRIGRNPQLRGHLTTWFASKCEAGVWSNKFSQCLGGFLASIQDDAVAFFRPLIDAYKSKNWEPTRIADLLLHSPSTREIWNMVEECGSEVKTHYWSKVYVRPWDNDAHLERVMSELLEANRPLAALYFCEYSLDKVAPEQLLAAMYFARLCPERDIKPPQYWIIEKIFERLEQAKDLNTSTLLQIEFMWYETLRHGETGRACLLIKTLMTDPHLFAEIIQLSAKAESPSTDTPTTDASRAASRIANSILGECDLQPGQREDGTIDSELFHAFVSRTRELCQNADRARTVDYRLGEIFSRCAMEEDGIWPYNAACDTLESDNRGHLRRGFEMGCYNGRGLVSRGHYEGGRQERDLVKVFQERAGRLRLTHPKLSATLSIIARRYGGDAFREDDEAELSKDRY